MAAFSSSSSKLSLKILIDTKTKRVLFAEANKEFVDFLFSILSIPIGTVIRLLSKNSMVGSLGDLYDSIENLLSRTSTISGGFVKGMATYIVTDDLAVKPMSTTSGITMMNTLNVKEVHGLEEKVVSFEMEEGLMLLKASLQCKNVLTSVTNVDTCLDKN